MRININEEIGEEAIKNLLELLKQSENKHFEDNNYFLDDIDENELSIKDRLKILNFKELKGGLKE